MGLEQIYTEVLAEHSRSGHNKHHLAHAPAVEKGSNPTCGDEIELELLEKDGVIEDASFTGTGCAISQASTSIMIDLIRGRKKSDALRLAETFFGMIKNEITDEKELETLEDAVALKDISHMPARVKCAVLCWHTLENAIGRESSPTT